MGFGVNACKTIEISAHTKYLSALSAYWNEYDTVQWQFLQEFLVLWFPQPQI